MNNGQSRQAGETFDKKEIQSAYFSAGAGFKSMVYVEVTGRNDWSSTLPSSNRSYFYPSVSLSGIISEMLPMPGVIDYLKVRASYAKVGNDTDPYQLDFVWSAYESAVNGGLLEMSLPTTYPLADLKPESTRSFEVGLDFRMLHGHLGLDFTYYATATTDQILQVATASSSGYDARMFNAGKVESRGVELMLTGTPVHVRDWKWDLTLNFGKNETKCVELTDNIKRYTLGSTRVASVVVNEGSRFGDIVAATAYRRDAAGRVLIDANGLPLTETDKVIGNMTPD